MNLHEYQAKGLLKEFGVPVPTFEVISDTDEALSAYDSLGAERVVVKAQVHAGGRGKAGGVKIVDNKQALTEAVKGLIGTFSNVSDYANGQPVHHYAAMPSDIDRELYLGALSIRNAERGLYGVQPWYGH